MDCIKTLVVFIFISSTSSAQNVGIIGGHNIAIEQVPFTVSVQIGTRPFCGGSIIHERFILTAAHCIVPFDDSPVEFLLLRIKNNTFYYNVNRKYNVRVGTDQVDKGGKLYDVEKIIIHQNYCNKTFDNDISLLKLNESLTFDKKVNKIPLAGKLKLGRGTYFNTTGWGYTRPNGSASEHLRQVTLPFVSKLSCQRMYKGYRITRRMLCAGGNGKDTCQGDSGGPLVRDGVQVGITSFGVVCGRQPGVYTKVVTMHKWIKENIKKNL